jgi:hypothetical protein
MLSTKPLKSAEILSNKVTKRNGRQEHMARMADMESLESKIEKAQADVVKTKSKYDASVAKLKDLMDKRDALKRDRLVDAIMKSDKAYEEILLFLNDGDDEE